MILPPPWNSWSVFWHIRAVLQIASLTTCTCNVEGQREAPTHFFHHGDLTSVYGSSTDPHVMHVSIGCCTQLLVTSNSAISLLLANVLHHQLCFQQSQLSDGCGILMLSCRGLLKTSRPFIVTISFFFLIMGDQSKITGQWAGWNKLRFTHC